MIDFTEEYFFDFLISLDHTAFRRKLRGSGIGTDALAPDKHIGQAGQLAV